MGKLQVVVGGQFGSEGKGAICAYLAKMEQRPLLAIRVGGPNAGHTAYDGDGRPWALRQIPVAAVARPDARVAIGQGSEVDLDVLGPELDLLRQGGHDLRGRIAIDHQATLLEEKHRLEEVELIKQIGSTGKGIGAARADRIMRRARVFGEAYRGSSVPVGDTARYAQKHLAEGGTVQVEAAQGYGLGLHAGHYPKCTSGDCRAIDALAMAGISPWAPAVSELEVWVVMRTYPIRVAGDSGPLSREITWQMLHRDSAGYIKPEKTTVTKKIRRVGMWDVDLARRAIRANGGPSVNLALTMVDYLWPEIAGFSELHQTFWDKIDAYVGHLTALVRLAGTGPQTVARRPT